jgi:L-fuculose-phosphate aldolase
MHVALYERFPAVASVVHAHPPRVQEIAAADRIPDCELLVEGRHLLGSVGRVDPIEPGSWRLAGAVVAALETAPACMMDRHGAVSVGPDVGVAVRRMLLLERLATLTLTATS